MGSEALDVEGEDAWLHPIDSRNERYRGRSCVWDVVVGLGGICSLCLGLILLVNGDWATYEGSPVREYVMFTMVMEVVIGLMAAMGVLVLLMTIGRDAVIYSLSAISLCCDGILSLVYFAEFVWGVATVYCLLRRNEFDIKKAAGLSPSGQLADRVSCCLLAYVTYNCLVSAAYTVSRIPLFFGVFGFFINHAWRKIKNTPIVLFHNEAAYSALAPPPATYDDEYYVRVMLLDENSDVLESMPNPLTQNI